MTGEQFEFVMAIETYKKVNKRLYPTWTEVLEVIRQLGYRKVLHRDVDLPNVPEPELLRDRVGLISVLARVRHQHRMCRGSGGQVRNRSPGISAQIKRE